MKKVWYCRLSGSTTPPKARHNTLEKACIEAQRLFSVSDSRVEVLELVAEFGPSRAEMKKIFRNQAKAESKVKTDPVVVIKKKRVAILPSS
jgi:hypothetical protein